MTEIDTIARAQMYLEKLAGGVNPLTDTEVNETDVVNNVRISRCLFYVSGILKQIVDNKGKFKVEMPDRADYTVTPEQLKQFAFSEQPISVSELTKRLNDLVNPLYVKELRRGVITDWLTEIGLLSDNIVNNKTRKRPTAQGMNIGIITEERTNQYGTPYEGVFYKNLYSVLDYEDVLLPKYSAEILRKYSDYLNHAVVQASGRKAYQEWVRLLKRMRKIEGGRELSRQIAADWRIRYKNRSAMMDEMKTL